MMDDMAIQRTFHQYYTNLYKRHDILPERIDEYIKRQKLPEITEEQKQLINGPITISEMEEVIKKIKLGKTQGPDGLPGSYYKHFEKELLQPLQNIMNSILNNGKIPDTWKTAYITLIPKEGQDLKLTKKIIDQYHY